MVKPQVLADAVLQGRAIAALGRLVSEFHDVVRPQLLRAEAALGHRLDAIADLRPRVAVDRPFQRALVVVDEESRRHDGMGRAFLALANLKRAGDGIGRARAQLALVVAGWKSGPQVRLRRQRLGQEWRRLVAESPLGGNVSGPGEALEAPRGVRVTATASGGGRAASNGLNPAP